MQGAKEYHKLSDLRAILADRFDRAHQPALFDRLAWFDQLHRHCFPNTEALALNAREEASSHDGGTEAWMFMTRPGQGRLSALANYYSFSWQPVFVGAPSADRKRALLGRIAADLARREKHLDMYPVLEDEGTLDVILDAFRRHGWIVVARQMGINHYLEVGGRRFDQYWNGRNGALRSTVRRKARQYPMEFEVYRHFDEQVWRDYESIYRNSWKPEEGSMAFLRAIAEDEGAAGTLRLGLARQLGEPVAAQFWTVENGVALIHKLAHDRRADAASPGTLLSVHMFRQAIDEDKVDVIDYGTGDNAYKTEWMERRRPLYRIDCFNLRQPSMWGPALKCKISRLVGRRASR